MWTGIPDEQLKLPVTFRLNSREPVTLNQILEEGEAAAQRLAQLSPEDRLSLTRERISNLPDFELELVGSGHVDQRRALLELEQGTEVGELLAEIEGRTIRRMLRRAHREDLL